MKKGRIPVAPGACGGHPDWMMQQQEAGRGSWMMVVQTGSEREAGAQETTHQGSQVIELASNPGQPDS